MVNMNKKIISSAVFAALLLAGVVSAQTTDLPDPGALPGSPFYFVKSIFEGLGTFLTFGNSAKAERYLALAERRLAEAEALAEQGDERAQAAVDRYEDRLAAAQERAERAANSDLENRVTDAVTKHLAVLDRVLEQVPDEAKDAIRAAKERSMTGQIEALRGIAQKDPEAAVDIFARAAEGRLAAAKARAESDVEDALAEYNKYAEFGQQISSLAEGIRTGETTVENLVRQAVSHHLQVLEDVRLQLPAQAQQEFFRAVDNAQRVREQRPVVPVRPPQPAPQPGGVQQQPRPGVQQQPSAPQQLPDARP